MADKIATRQAYGEFLVEKGKTAKNLIVMDADLSKSTMTAGFAKAFPDRFFNMGIAEQNLYGVAAGLAVSERRSARAPSPCSPPGGPLRSSEIP